MNPIFEITKLSFQKDFPQHTECRLRRIYGIDSQDKILFGLWTTGFFRKGFIFTDKALYWNLGFASERTCGCLPKSENEGVATFTMDKVLDETLNLSSQEAVNDFVFKLVIKTDKTEKALLFKEIPEKQKSVFLDTLNYGFNRNEFSQQDLINVMLSEKCLGFYNGLDCVMNFFYSAKEKIRKTFVSFSNNIETEKHQKQNTKGQKTKEKTEKIRQATEEPATKQISSARIFFAHFFDVIASLLFVSAVVVALKPELLAGVSFERISSSEIKHIGNFLLRVKLSEQIDTSLLFLRNFWVAVFLGSYFLLKLLVVFLCKGSKKIVAFLILVLTLLACWLVTDKFLLFVAFILLLYVCFELLCDFTKKSIYRKIILLVFLTICLYVVAHIVLMNEPVSLAFDKIGSALHQLRLAFAQFFRQLSLPILWW